MEAKQVISTPVHVRWYEGYSDSGWRIYDADNRWFARVALESEADEMARLINAHAKLVALLKEANDHVGYVDTLSQKIETLLATLSSERIDSERSE